MSIKDEPHYTISAADLASWLEAQDADSWWRVDGDQFLMGALWLPCPAEDLAKAIREMNRPLLILGPAERIGQPITAAEVDAIALKDVESGDRVFTMSWANAADNEEWVLVEDRDAARAAAAIRMRATGT